MHEFEHRHLLGGSNHKSNTIGLIYRANTPGQVYIFKNKNELFPVYLDLKIKSLG